jgi:3-oxoacyl-[acyl-carrier protein] reductase
MSGLKGKVALVTGGSRGIGAAIARRLAAEGADVALTYEKSAERAAAVVADIAALGRRAEAFRVDSGDAAAVAALVETVVAQFGRLDILVNNAGIYDGKPIDEASLAEYDRMMAVNVRGVFAAISAAARRMVEGSRIVTIGSCVADRVPWPGLSLYAASKSALIGLTKGAARDLGPRGITVNLVQPGPIDTDMNPADSAQAAVQDSFLALGGHGAGDDIAAMVAHLAGDGGRFVTGAALNVDGGMAV